MRYQYINFDLSLANDRWARRRFHRQRYSIYADDPYWAPSLFAWSQRAVRSGHVDRMQPALIRLEAVRRRISGSGDGTSVAGMGMPISVFEEGVATVALLFDPRREDRTAYLAHLHVVNDEECLDRLLDGVSELLWERGGRRLIGPVDWSSHFGVGALLNHFNGIPPMYTPYNPPYVPELLSQSLQPFHRRRLFVHTPSTTQAAPAPSTVTMAEEEPRGLATHLLPLLQTACASAHFPPPDAREATFMLDAVGQWPSSLWVARVDGEPAGFVWLQGDFAPLLRRTQGGRNPFWLPWVAVQRRRPTRKGRLLFGAVLPKFQGRGMGRQLWAQVNRVAVAAGWRTLTIGPVDAESSAAQFLQHMGASAHQGYALYEAEL